MSSSTRIIFYGGVNEIGGNKFLVEDKGTRIFLDFGNHQAAIKQVKMQGGVFGWVSDSKRFVNGVMTEFT